MREHRVFGPPGTGKTTRLAKEITRAYERFGDSILVASFTRAAAHELIARDLPLSRNRVGTLHSLCFRALGNPEIADCPKGLKAWNTDCPPRWQLEIRGQQTIDDPMGFTQSGQKSVLEEYSMRRNELMPLDRMPFTVRSFAKVWEDWKTETSRMDFTDLISKAYADLPEPPFPCAVGFFDEVQDFTPLELALVRQWGKSMKHFVLAGDDDQNLYSFRGATPDAFLSPIPDEQVTVLDHSWRLPSAVKDYADRWISARVARRKEKLFSPRAQGGSVETAHTGYHDGDGVAQIIEEHSKNGTVMLLASCGFMLNSTMRRLRELGIPYHNPYRPTHGGWNPLRGGAERLLAFLDRPWTWGTLWRWLEHVDATTLGPGAKKMAREHAGEAGTRDQTVTSDYLHVLGRLGEATPAWLQGSLLKSKQQLWDYAFTVFKKGGELALRDPPKLTVGSIHSVKGGESDTVILAPDLSRAATMETVKGQVAHDAIARMFYVGMTRARERLILLQPGGALHGDLPWARK